MILHGTLRGVASEAELVYRWRGLLATYNGTALRLDRELQAAHGINMSDFEALDRLVNTGKDQCRMLELAGDMYLTQSALSRSVARLERAGLVTRTLCEADRRGVFVQVTDAGKRLHAEARTTWLTILADQLDATEPRRLV